MISSVSFRPALAGKSQPNAFKSAIAFKGSADGPDSNDPVKTEKASEKPADKPVLKTGPKPADTKYRHRLNPMKGVAYLFTHPRIFRKLREFLPPGHFNGLLIPESKLNTFGKLNRVDFKSLDGMALKGYWMPAESGSKRTVVLGHGFMVDYRMFIPIADRLRKEGFNVFLFDFRGHGESGGNETSIGFHEGKDVAAAVDYVVNHFASQSERLFYMGHSMGASSMMATPKSLAEYPQALAMLNAKLDGIILDAPFHKIAPTSNALVRKMLSYQPVSPTMQTAWKTALKGLGPVGTVLVESLFRESEKYTGYSVKDFKTAPIFASDPLSKKPILHIHGTKDAVTPFTHALKIKEMVGTTNPDYQLLALENADHLDLGWTGLGDGNKYSVVQRGGEFYFEQVLKFLNKIDAQKTAAQTPASEPPAPKKSEDPPPPTFRGLVA